MYQFYGRQNTSNSGNEDKKRQKNTIQVQMIIMESDGRKLMNEKNILDAEIRKIGRDIDRLKVELSQKKERLAKVSDQIIQNEEEIKRLKKKLATLQ